jgi:hypothetical protein
MGKWTLVLYVRPKPPPVQIKDKVECRWSFDTEEGGREYEAALAKHLQDKRKPVPCRDFPVFTSN